MKTVVGLFDTFDEARNVVRELVDGGFDRDNISLVANNSSGEYSTYTDEDADGQPGEPGATGAGATTGAVVGGTLGVLAGLGALGALVIPGIGPVIAFRMKTLNITRKASAAAARS
jgi:hypothetical protein